MSESELDVPINTLNALNDVVNMQSGNIISFIASKINSKHLYLYVIGLIFVIGCMVYYYYKMKNDVIQVLSSGSLDTRKQSSTAMEDPDDISMQGRSHGDKVESFGLSERKTRSPRSDTKIDIAEIIKPPSKIKYSPPTEIQDDITPEEDIEFIDIDDQISSYESDSEDDIDAVQMQENDNIKQQNLSQRDLIDINKQLKSMNKKIKTI